MNKDEFLDILQKDLLRLSKADRDDIMNDYESHFAMGTAAGQTEEEVSAALGDPHELAAVYLENLPADSKGAPNADAETQHPSAPRFSAPTYSNNNNAYSVTDASAPSAPRSDRAASPSAGAIVGVVFLSLAALTVLFCIIDIWAVLPSMAIANIALGFSLLIAGAASSDILICIGGIIGGISLFALAGLFVVASIAAVKGIIILVKLFIKLCKNILNGGMN